MIIKSKHWADKLFKLYYKQYRDVGEQRGKYAEETATETERFTTASRIRLLQRI